MWYKLKRILIYPDGVTEKQVYPAPIRKSIDVRWKTLAQIQAEWWGLNYWKSYTLDSNWISVSANNAWVAFYYPLSLSNAHNITLKYTWYTNWWGSWYWWGAALWISNNVDFSTTMEWYLLGMYQSWNNAWWKGTNIRLWFNNVLSTSWGNNTSWDINQTFVINLDTWVCTYTITSPVTFNTSVTLTSAQLAQVKQYWYICFTPQEWTANYIMRLYTAEFTIK